MIMNRKRYVPGNFGVRPSEFGGVDSLRKMATTALEAGATSLTCTVPRGFAPTEEMYALQRELAGRISILFSSVFDLSCPDAPFEFEPDLKIGELQSIIINRKRVPYPQRLEDMPSFLRECHYDAGSVMYTIMTTLAARFKAEFDVVRLPDFQLLLDAMDTEERYKLKWGDQLSLAVDALIDRGVVFDCVLQKNKFGKYVYPVSGLTTIALRRMGERMGRITISSAAERAEELFDGFSSTFVMLYACGIANWELPMLGGKWNEFSLRYNCKKIENSIDK